MQKKKDAPVGAPSGSYNLRDWTWGFCVALVSVTRRSRRLPSRRTEVYALSAPPKNRNALLLCSWGIWIITGLTLLGFSYSRAHARIYK